MNAAPGFRLSAYITPINRSRAWTGTQSSARIPVADDARPPASSASERASALTTACRCQDALDRAQAAAELFRAEVLPGQARAGRDLQVAPRSAPAAESRARARQLEHRGHDPRQQPGEPHPGSQAALDLAARSEAPQPLLFHPLDPLDPSAEPVTTSKRATRPPKLIQLRSASFPEASAVSAASVASGTPSTSVPFLLPRSATDQPAPVAEERRVAPRDAVVLQHHVAPRYHGRRPCYGRPAGGALAPAWTGSGRSGAPASARFRIRARAGSCFRG